MLGRFVELTSSSESVQEALIVEVLGEAGIPFDSVQGGGGQSLWLGAVSPIGYTIFRVPEDRLQEAKDLLCQQGLVCDVSERLLRRTFDEVVRPLLGSPEPRLDRLAYLVSINNKETVRALFQLTAEHPGGLALLEALYFHIAAEAGPAFHSLTRLLGGKTSKEFARRFCEQMESGAKAARLGMLDVLHELPTGFPRETALASALRDSDPDLREAAADALFTLKHGESFGYDPNAGEGEREAAVDRFLRASRLPGAS